MVRAVPSFPGSGRGQLGLYGTPGSSPKSKASHSFEETGKSLVC